MKIDQNPLAENPNEGMAQRDPIFERVRDRPPRRANAYPADCTARMSAKGQARRWGTTDLSDIFIAHIKCQI